MGSLTMYKKHNKCRACGNTSLIPAFDLGLQPLANDFTPETGDSNGYAPLEVLFCQECTLAQLSVVVKPEILYANYPYVTSRSQTMQRHFTLLWEAIKQECHPDSVVEIGSNDGCFLEFCRHNGAGSVMGIDPAENLKPAGDSGIVTVCGVFDSHSAGIARAAMPPVDAVVARHVFAHVDDWHGFIKSLDMLATKNTLIVIECPYVVDLLKNLEFDTIYHEHLSYISIKAINRLLDGSLFHLHKILRFDVHGGAIVMMLRRNDSEVRVDPSVAEFTAREDMDFDSWLKFDDDAHRKIYDLKRMVAEAVHGQGRRVCGFGASAKSTVWINACGFTAGEIEFICDSTPQKQGRRSPGPGIPIVSEQALVLEQPDYAVCFAWNFLEDIKRTQKQYLDGGGRFIVPFPDVRIL